MSVIGPDSRQVITSFGTFPISTVTTVDIQTSAGSFVGSGITIAPNHVLTAGHNPYNASNNTIATSLRTTTSANEDALRTRIIGFSSDPPANVTNVNFVDNYNVTGNPGDDIALFTTSDAPIAASDVIGLIAFVDPATTTGLTIDTAGYPGDNVSGNIPGNTGVFGRDLVRSPGAAESPGNIVFTSNGRFFYSQDVDTAGGQSGSGVWHTLDGDPNPRVLGIHAYGSSTNNSGVLITTDIYDEIIDQIETDSGTTNANDLPENAIIGGTANDDIFGSYRRERIIGNDGNDRLFGGGANDRLEGGDGVDQALFSEIFTNYDFTITDPLLPAFQFIHARGSQSDATDTTKDIEFGVFEFVDADENGTDDDGNLFFVPLQVDPDDNTKLKDGALITPEEDILDDEGNKIGTITVESPAWMFDGDVNYTLTLGSEQGLLYNFAYIFDSSGSMSGTRIVEAKAAYQELTQSLIDDGIAANSEFAVVDFDSSASLFAPLDAPTTISTINGLVAGGLTNFNSALVEAQNFFTSRNNNATNIAYFLSDGFNNGPDFSSSAAQLQQLAEVRAFGIGNPSLSELNIVDSDDAVVLSDPADLITEFNAATIDKNIIERIDVKLAGTVVDTITPDQLIEDTLGLKFEGTIDGLEVTRTAENDVTFDVVFNDGTPTASLDYKITTGQEQVTQQTDNGTKQIITFSVNQTDFVESTQSQSISQENNQSNLENTVASQPVIREINANDLDNTIQVSDGQNTIFGNGGNDRFILLGGVNLVDGGVGIDTVEINKTQTDAGGVSKNGNIVNIGTDNTLLNVEFIQFSDVRLAVDTLTVTPTLSLANQGISLAEGNTGSTTATFTVNLSSTTTEDVVIDFATRSDNADAGTDFVENTGQLTIAAGQTSGDITLEILGDTDVEGDESVSLDLSVVSGGTFANGATTATAGVNIIDDDSVISIPITGGDPTVVEGDSDAPSTLTLTLDRFGGLNGTDTIKVEIIEKGDNPAQASDFVDGFSSSEVTFAAGEDTKTIDIAINPDREIEGDETFGVKLTSVSGTALVPSEDLIFTILNDDANTPPTITSNPTFQVAENTTTVGTITANDADGNDLSFSITGGADQGLFSINDSGELSFINAPDFETAADADADNNYQVQIAVSDGAENVAQDLTITVENVNETPTVDDATFTVDENSTSGTEVGIITATDPEKEALTFAISSGNLDPDNDSNLAFAIDPSTGTITVNDKDDLDFEVTPTFNLEVTATDAGDLTDTANITVNLNDVAPAQFETESNNGIFTLNGGDSTNVKFTLSNNNTENVNEVGVFVVNNENGNVDGNAPGSDGYLKAALQRSQIIFSAISDRPSGFDLGDIERVIEVDSDAHLGFYLVSNGTTDTALAELAANGTTNLPIFFSDSSNLQVSDLVAESFNLNWSDEAGNSDFTNLDLTVQLTQDAPASATELQGNLQNELIDLSNESGQVSVSVEVHREAAFDNLIGFYQVLDSKGGIDTNGDGVIDFNPGDAGYEEAALTNRITSLDLLQTDEQQTSSFDGTFDGGNILASFMVVDGTVDEAINNNAEVYFSFLGANSDGVDHIRLLGDNTFGYEDLAGGGDFDYNDMIVKVDFPTV
ncbi:V8-like Glu-specific endopeptidase [Rivularia sp. PCC 7116]|uniref:cadherin domain-containing protein n=1 Tax=Rivularia sp. PCC 7116 TaxID=373994 RepID=UPI00029F27F2|nr:cadherin domain-containing protein [Rivularia sp. PCC 7116]AFY58654.1 V8-like Glu-specific endopeptidase [Rivularia sp. PCC 7116]